MNKKRLIIIISIVTILIVLIVIGINTSNSNNTLSDSKLYDNKYYVEKGIEQYVPLVKNSIESINKQDSSESNVARVGRLSKYFSSDSPVYEYTLDNIDSIYSKSETNITSIINCPDQDDEYLCLSVMANLTHKSTKDQYSEQVSYWITIKKDSDNKYRAYDTGTW